MSKFDWPTIRARWEAGEEMSAISESLGGRPTRQAIWNRQKREGWERQLQSVDGVLLPRVQLPESLTQGLKTEQLAVLREIVNGATQSAAAGMVGVARSTVTNWIKTDERFEQAAESARALKTMRRVQKIEDDPTWKSAAWLVQHDPDSKSEYASESKGQLVGNTFNVLGTVALGISREEQDVSPREGKALEAQALRS